MEITLTDLKAIIANKDIELYKLNIDLQQRIKQVDTLQQKIQSLETKLLKIEEGNDTSTI